MLQSQIATVSMVSTHEEEEGLSYAVPNVHPGRFWIPPITAPEKLIRERCWVMVRPPGASAPERVRYAQLKPNSEWSKQKFVLLTIPEASTFRYGTERQIMDEYGAKMVPDIERAALYIKPELLANDIERALGPVGVITALNYDPDAEDAGGTIKFKQSVLPFLKRSQTNYDNWMLSRVNELNKSYARYGFAEVTPQTLRIVNRLFRDHKIAAMPSWANITTDTVLSGGQSTCPQCHQLVLPGVAQCKCGVVVNWKLALEYGLKSPAEVPQGKRREAGLEGPIEVTSAPAPDGPTIVGSLGADTAVAIVSAEGVQKIGYNDVPTTLDDQSFGGELRHAGKEDAVERAMVESDEPEVVSAGKGRVQSKRR